MITEETAAVLDDFGTDRVTAMIALSSSPYPTSDAAGANEEIMDCADHVTDELGDDAHLDPTGDDWVTEEDDGWVLHRSYTVFIEV